MVAVSAERGIVTRPATVAVTLRETPGMTTSITSTLRSGRPSAVAAAPK
jgi:hypothetical protein